MKAERLWPFKIDMTECFQPLDGSPCDMPNRDYVCAERFAAERERAARLMEALRFIVDCSPEPCDLRAGYGHHADCAKIVAVHRLAADPAPEVKDA